MDSRALRWLLAIAIASVAFYLVFILLSNAGKVAEALSRVSPIYLAAALLLSLASYGVRALRWNYYLGRLEVRLSRRLSLLLYFAGLSMLVTPAMVSGVVKVGLVKARLGVELSRTLPIVVVERLTDLVGMLLLAVVGALSFGLGFISMSAVVLFLVVVVALVRVARFRHGVLWVIGHIPGLRHHTQRVESLLDSAQTLLDGQALVVGSLYGLISWGLLGLSLYLLVLGFGLDLNLPETLFLFAFPAILGIMSQSPGGLAVEETGMVTLLNQIKGVELPTATALVVLFRLVSLWFGLALGLAALGAYTGSLDNTNATEAADD